MLLIHHRYAHIYQHTYEILNDYDPLEDVLICLQVGSTHDRRFNLPTADEVAVILPGVDGDDKHVRERDIVLHSRAGELQIITDLHPAYVPLYYVLLFPYGEHGWHPAMRLSSSNSGSEGRCLMQTQFVIY